MLCRECLLTKLFHRNEIIDVGELDPRLYRCFPVLEFSIAISLALIVSGASLVALIGRVSVDFK